MRPKPRKRFMTVCVAALVGTTLRYLFARKLSPTFDLPRDASNAQGFNLSLTGTFFGCLFPVAYVSPPFRFRRRVILCDGCRASSYHELASAVTARVLQLFAKLVGAVGFEPTTSTV